jgi:hypothetical protein
MRKPPSGAVEKGLILVSLGLLAAPAYYPFVLQFFSFCFGNQTCPDEFAAGIADELGFGHSRVVLYYLKRQKSLSILAELINEDRKRSRK